ncbi:NAD(P)H-dependent oxidoreductase [Celeribacter baekdonensis]|uniref:NAD(P)H-dependent oxidoreductase n=1 Tax=Celeribacter baekdonensis TaxID=875171 RepID=UPI0030DC59CD|tara:strand:- start:87117 stop:87737 length:621 start_codon:yes stop_codon:yes gene_type:complete
MNVLIVYNHPYEGSFCAAILAAVTKGLLSAGHEIDLMHLDADDFDPVMRSKDLRAFAMARNDPEAAFALLDPRVQAYRDRLQAAEHIVFVFPIWWELMPARMKGFVDKVIFPGIAYDYTEKGSTGMVSLLKRLKGVTVITTMNTPWYLYWLIFGNAIQRALMRGTFWKIGVKNRTWISLNNVKGQTQAKRQSWLTQIEGRMRGLPM